MNRFKTFNEDFFKSVKGIKWIDKDGLYPIDDTRVARITITDRGYADNYKGYVVEIYGKQSGVIVTKMFSFKEHLKMVHKGESEYCHVWDNGGKFDWYISRPTNTKDMSDEIMEFINTFK